MKTLLILYTLISTQTAFEYRNPEPESLFPHTTALQHDISPVLFSNPSLLPFADGMTLGCSASRPYSENLLSAGNIGMQYGNSILGAGINWNTFGGDFYREQIIALRGGVSLCSYLNAGVSGNIYILNIDTGEISENRRISDIDCSILIKPADWLIASYLQTSALSHLKKKNVDIIYPERSFGILLKPENGFSLCWNITDTDAELANSFSAAVNPSSFLSLKGGYSHENSGFSAAAGVLAGDFYIAYGLKYHPYLGYTHSLSLAFQINPSMESIDYGNHQRREPDKKIDIQNASPDELTGICGVSGTLAERIVLYRDRFGPVTEKSLIQLGMNREEALELSKCVTGLERSRRENDNENKRAGYKRRPPRSERIKKKFRALVTAGIPAYTAISYSELSETVSAKEFRERLSYDSTLSEEQKRVIGKTCSD